MKKGIHIVLIVCLITSCLYVPKAEAKTLGDLKRELVKFENEYNSNKAKLELSEKEKNNVKRNISSISSKIAQSEKDVISLNERIVELDKEIKKNESEIKEILAFSQIQNGESAYLEYAFGATDFTDFIYKIAVSEQLTSYNEKLVEQSKKNIEENKSKTVELEKKKIELSSEQEKMKVELNKIQLYIQELDDEALSIEDQIEARRKEIKVYQDLKCKDDEDINTCGRNVLPPDTAFWRPITKGIISGSLGLFGQRSPCGGAVSCFHNGLDFTTSGAASGSIPIYSAANGIVMTVLYKQSCGGNKVFIQHNVNGQLLMTGYLHLRSVSVKEGDRVTKDTQIGVMGGNESYDSCSAGTHLHFEVSRGSHAKYNYGENRFNPKEILNVPKNVNEYWYDRTKKF